MLQERSKQFINLSRITGTDLKGNIADMTRVFGDWSVAGDQQAGTLDMIFRASQTSGIGINALSQKVVQFGAPLRQMGFGLDGIDRATHERLRLAIHHAQLQALRNRGGHRGRHLP